MLVVLTIICILVLIENRNSFKQISLDPKTYFWVFANLIVLGFVVSKALPLLSHFFDKLGILQAMSLLDFPIYVQFFAFLIFVDFLKFSLHFLLHKFDFLWKLHMIHHSSESVTTLASFKLSWGEAFINIVMSCLFQKILVIEPFLLIYINAILLYICIWQHSKIQYPKAALMSSILVTPKNHRIHHEMPETGQHSNYGLILTLWDRLFGTFKADESASPKYGIKSLDYPFNSEVKQFLYPFYNPTGRETKEL